MSCLWIFISLNVISKLHGYPDGSFPEVCDSMRPLHGMNGAETPPQESSAPFMVSYQLGSNVGDPITVSLQSKGPSTFRGFMLEARTLSLDGEGPPLGKFIILDPTQTRLLTCGSSEGSAVSNNLNVGKSLIKVNWTADGEEQDIIFRATFLQTYLKYWERVNVTVLRPKSTTTPETTATTKMPTTEPETTATTKMRTTEPVTTAITKMPTTEPETTATTKMRTTEPETTATTKMPTTEPESTATTKMPTTEPETTATTKMPTTEPETTATTKMPTTEPVITTMEIYTTQDTHNTADRTEPVDIALMCLNSAFVEMKMQIPNIIMAVHPPTSCHHYLTEISRIVGSSISVAFSVSTLIVFYINNTPKDIYIGPVCVVLVIGFIEWVITMLPFGPSQRINDPCGCALRVLFPFQHIFTNAFIYIRVIDLFQEWGETKRIFWMMIFHTVLICLTIIWDIVLWATKKLLQQRAKAKARRNQGHQGKQENVLADVFFNFYCSSAIISATLMVLIVSLSMVIIVEIFCLINN